MRFSETLRFNANPDWWIYYIPYDELKRQVAVLRNLHDSLYLSTHQESSSGHRDAQHHAYESSEDERDVEAPHDNQRQSLSRTIMRRSASQRVLAQLEDSGTRVGYGAVLGGLRPVGSEEVIVSVDSPPAVIEAKFKEQDQLFFEKLNKSATQVDEFYGKLCAELKAVTAEMEQDAVPLLYGIHNAENSRSQVEDTPLLYGTEEPNNSNALCPPSEAEIVAFRKRLIEHYKELGETVNYAMLNRTGFDKILKKHDKYTRRSSRASLMATLMRETSFMDTEEIEILQQQTEKTYADVFKEGNMRTGKEELQEGLRDLIVWDRNTIWRDVLRSERRVSAFRSLKGGGQVDIGKAASEVVWLPRALPVTAAFLAFIVILMFPRIVHNMPVDGGIVYSAATLSAAHRCLAITAGVVILWAFEGIPLYMTSFLVLPATVILKVFLDESGNPLDSREASKAVFSHLSSPTLLLIICVYALGAALSKFEIDKLVATSILSRIRRPHYLLCAVMFLAVFISMFVSNVAAPVLLNSVMMPTIDAMRSSERNRKFVRCLLLGIMVSSNVGGFASPIASPQSAVALGLLTGEHRISFLKWLLVAIPQCVAMVLAFFAVLFFIYKPNEYTLPPLPRFSEKLTWPHWIIIVTVLMTILLWSDHALSDVFGGAGVVAVMPLLVLFGSGILNKEDFNNLPWDVVYLVAGGIVLGAAVESCNLLDLVAERLTKAIGTSNLRLSYCIFCIFMASVANAVSHTVSAIIVLPLIFKVGVTLGHPQLLVLGGTFAASSAMAFPISSFPNISAIQVEDEKGDPYLTSAQVLKIGSLMTLIATVVLLTFGYELMTGIGL